MIPEPVTPPERDTGRRAQTIYDLEETLVTFLAKLLDSYRLDNPTLNLAQATRPEHPMEPPAEFVPYDPTERAQTLVLKVPPRVVRGRVPRTVTGEILVDRLPDFPAVIVQAISGRVQNDETIVTVRMFVNCYDENPDSGGYQDCQNITEVIAMALTSYGQAGIDKAYPIVMPMEWKLIEEDTFPHFVAEITSQWELPSARPLPDPELGFVPAEQITLGGTYAG
jgi:hypothetical protein